MLCVLALWTLPAPARAGGPSPLDGGHGWLSAWGGAALDDTVLLGDGAEAGSLALESLSAAPLFGVGGHYRAGPVDVGLVLEALGSGRFGDEAPGERLGSTFRAAAALRWRATEASWGSLFVRLTPGLVVLGHSPALRARAAELTAAVADEAAAAADGEVEAPTASAEEASVGFTFGFGAGIQLALSARLALVVQLDVIANLSAVATDDGGLAYRSVRSTLAAGLEWRM